MAQNKKETVFLPGASGTMGYEAFKEIWGRKDSNGERKYNLVLLQRPSKKNKKLFRPYEKEAGIESIPGKGIVEQNGLKIIWGDASDKDAIYEACKGIDWVLNALAIIPPATELWPDKAREVNFDFVKHVIEALKLEPNGLDRIKYIHVGSISQTGDRLAPIHMARIGDPIKACVCDYYTITKNMAERYVLSSNLKYWASLRVTFIMSSDIFDMQGPYMFYQPLRAFMENITERDSGLGLANCLNIPEDSDFWCRVYSMTGGPSCRTNYIEVLKRTFAMLGMDYRNIMERRWFATRNYHMHYFEDSHILNEYLHFRNDNVEDYLNNVWNYIPKSLKIVAWLNKHIKPFKKLVEKATYGQMKKMANSKPDGPLYWLEHGMEGRLNAFYGGAEGRKKIPDWDVDMPQMDPVPEWNRLDHGYDESKKKLDLSDLQNAAKFRGGQCLSKDWDGNMYARLKWKCAFNHEFTSRPYTLLKAGYWCPNCAPPPWNYDEIAKKNPFFAQTWYPFHDKNEANFYPKELVYEFEKIMQQKDRRKI